MKLTAPLCLTKISYFNLFFEMILILKTDFGEIQEQLSFS